MAEEMSASPKVMARHDQLETFCIQVLQRLGVPQEEAEITARTLVTANLRGVDTHGVIRLPALRGQTEGRCSEALRQPHDGERDDRHRPSGRARWHRPGDQLPGHADGHPESQGGRSLLRGCQEQQPSGRLRLLPHDGPGTTT